MAIKLLCMFVIGLGQKEPLVKNVVGASLLAEAHYANIFSLDKPAGFRWKIKEMGRYYCYISTDPQSLKKGEDAVNSCEMILDRSNGGIVGFSKSDLKVLFSTLEAKANRKANRK